MVDRAEQERLRQDAQHRRNVADRRHIDAVEVDGADAGLLDGLAFFAELPGMEHPDALASAGAFRHQLVHVEERLDGGVAFFLDVGGAELAGAKSVQRPCQRERRHGRAGPYRHISG